MSGISQKVDRCEVLTNKLGSAPNNPLSAHELKMLQEYFSPDQLPEEMPAGLKMIHHHTAALKGHFEKDQKPGEQTFTERVGEMVAYSFGEAGNMVGLRYSEVNCGEGRRDPKVAAPPMKMFWVELNGRPVVVAKIEKEWAPKWYSPLHHTQSAIAVVEIAPDQKNKNMPTKGLLAVNQGPVLISPVFGPKWTPNKGND